MAVYLATFEPEPGASRILCEQAGKIPIFDDIWAISPAQLPAEFHAQHGDFAKQHIAAPLYAWGLYKPYVLTLALTRMAAGDVLFYVGHTCAIAQAPEARARMTDYVDLAQSCGLVGFELIGTALKYYVRPTLLDTLDTLPQRHAPLMSSEVWVVQKGAVCDQFARAWLAFATPDARAAFLPQPERTPPLRYDAAEQGVFSLLWHKYNGLVLCGEIYRSVLLDICSLVHKQALGADTIQSPRDIANLRQWHAATSTS